MRQLLECGVHFGHQTKRWNPKMKKYIFTSRNGIHVIDLQQSIQLINVAYEFLKEVVANNGTVLFVGTKKQAQDAVRDESTRCEMPFVNHRWLGGTLTNISTIRQSINKLKDYEKMVDTGMLEQFSKKEQSKRTKTYTKLKHTLSGIKDMKGGPSVIFIVDTQKEQLAVKEAKKLNIPIVGIVDTNADPSQIDYPIPANDDAIRAVKLICSVMSDAVTEGRKASLALNEQLKEAASKNAAASSPTKESAPTEQPKKEQKKTVEKKNAPSTETEKKRVTTKKEAPKTTAKKAAPAKKSTDAPKEKK